MSTWHVYVKMKFRNGQTEKRHLWLDELRTEADAMMAASQAVDSNPGVVLAAWVEPAPEPKPKVEPTKAKGAKNE